MNWSRLIILQVLVATCVASSFFDFLYEPDERALILSKSEHGTDFFEDEAAYNGFAQREESTSEQPDVTTTEAETWTTDEASTSLEQTTEFQEVTTSTELQDTSAPTEAPTTEFQGVTTSSAASTTKLQDVSTSTVAPTTEAATATTTLSFTESTINPDCKDHDEQCSYSKECCRIPDMSCWDHSSLPHPMCKCDFYFTWDEEKHRCYPISISEQMMMAAFMAFSSAIIVAMLAFCFHSCKNCSSYRNRMRNMRNERQHRATRRHNQRQHMRVPTEQHNLSVFVLKETQPSDLGDVKLPAYEEINAHQLLFTSIASEEPRRPMPYMSLSPPEYAVVVNETPAPLHQTQQSNDEQQSTNAP